MVLPERIGGDALEKCGRGHVNWEYKQRGPMGNEMMENDAVLKACRNADCGIQITP